MTITTTTAHKAARSQASMNFADSAGASRIQLFDASDTVLVTLTLSTPCGTLDGHLIRLTQAASIGDQIVADGVAVKGQWQKGSGEVVAEGSVSDAAGTGDFKITSAAGTSLYAGGYVLLGQTALS